MGSGTIAELMRRHCRSIASRASPPALAATAPVFPWAGGTHCGLGPHEHATMEVYRTGGAAGIERCARRRTCVLSRACLASACARVEHPTRWHGRTLVQPTIKFPMLKKGHTLYSAMQILRVLRLVLGLHAAFFLCWVLQVCNAAGPSAAVHGAA